MDKFMLYLLIAGKKALEEGEITEEVQKELDISKCRVLIGSAMGGMKVFNDPIEALRVFYKMMNPFCVPLASTKMGPAMLTMGLGWMGPNYSISTACATGNFCLLNAMNHILRGEAVWEALWHAKHFLKEMKIPLELLVHGMLIVMDLLWLKEPVFFFLKSLNMQREEEHTYMQSFLAVALLMMLIT